MADQLLDKLIQGDEQVFEDIYHTYHAKVYNFILRYTEDKDTARELTQVSFIKLWEKRERLAKHKPFDGQFFVMIRNLTIDAIRKQGRILDLREAYQSTYESTESTTENSLAHTELVNYLESVIEQLPEKRQRIFRLNRQEGMTYQEIAHQLAISPKTVEQQMSKALKFLREELGGFLFLFL